MIRTISAAFICIVFLTGCSWLDDWPPGNSSAERSSLRIVENGAGSYHAEQGRALPPPYVQQEQQVDSAHDQAGSDRAEAREVTGLDLTPLNSSARTASAMPVEERLAILEENVMQIQSMMSRMQPAMERFAGLEDSLQRLLHDMEGAAAARAAGSGNNNDRKNTARVPENLLPVSSSAVMSGQYAEAPQAAQTAAMVQKGTIRQLRIGEHPEKTRIVMDATAGLDFNIHNENQGRVLIVDLPAAGWDTAASMPAANSPLIESYQSQPDGNGGTRLFLSLKKDVRVLWAEALAPVGDKGHRIVIDLAGA